PWTAGGRYAGARIRRTRTRARSRANAERRANPGRSDATSAKFGPDAAPTVELIFPAISPQTEKPRVLRGASGKTGNATQTLNEEPQPQVLFTFGLSNLNPAPSRVST